MSSIPWSQWLLLWFLASLVPSHAFTHRAENHDGDMDLDTTALGPGVDSMGLAFDEYEFAQLEQFLGTIGLVNPCADPDDAVEHIRTVIDTTADRQSPDTSRPIPSR